MVRGNVLAFCKIGGGGGASAVGTTNFNKADGSGDVSSENEYTNVMFWYLFLRRPHTMPFGARNVASAAATRRHAAATFAAECRLFPSPFGRATSITIFIIKMSLAYA